MNPLASSLVNLLVNRSAAAAAVTCRCSTTGNRRRPDRVTRWRPGVRVGELHGTRSAGVCVGGGGGGEEGAEWNRSLTLVALKSDLDTEYLLAVFADK